MLLLVVCGVLELRSFAAGSFSGGTMGASLRFWCCCRGDMRWLRGGLGLGSPALHMEAPLRIWGGLGVDLGWTWGGLGLDGSPSHREAPLRTGVGFGVDLGWLWGGPGLDDSRSPRSQEHTYELQALVHLVCRLVL